MEGQGFNPTPTPTPAPAPDDAGPATEPVAQDSFAQQPVNTGASWQPSQATAPQVGGMNVAPTMPAQAPVQKKSNAGLIIAIILAAAVLIGLIIAIIFVLTNKNNSTTTTTDSGSTSKTESGSGSNKGSGKTEVSEEQLKALQRAQRDTQREDDIARFLTAVNDYQTNNNGKTPFGTVGDGSDANLTVFVKRYIDADVIEAENGSLAVCGTEGRCLQFSDPDKTMYGFKVMNVARYSANKDSMSEFDHIIKVIVNGECGDEEGDVVMGRGNRQIAMLYTLESGKIVCNDNH